MTNPLTLRLTREHKELIVKLGLKAKEMNSAQRMRLYKKYRRKPGTDALLSLLLPGLGQMVQKGVRIGLTDLCKYICYYNVYYHIGEYRVGSYPQRSTILVAYIFKYFLSLLRKVELILPSHYAY